MVIEHGDSTPPGFLCCVLIALIAIFINELRVRIAIARPDTRHRSQTMLLSVRVACRPLRTSLAAAARSEAAGPRNRGAAALARGLRAAAAARVAATAQAGVAPRGAAAVACSAAAGRRRSARGVAKSAAAQGGAPLSSSSRSSRAEFKAALRAGRPLFGLFINSASPLVAEQLAWIEGFDYMLVRERGER